MCGRADAGVGFLARDMPGVRVRVHRAERLTSQGFYDRPQTTQRHFRPRKPSPRRVAQEGFMATPVCRLEPTDISGNPRFGRQQRQLDPPIDTMSSPSRVLRRGGGRLPSRAEPASGQPGNERPLQETVRGAEARADRSIGGQSRLIPPIPPCERILLIISNRRIGFLRRPRFLAQTDRGKIARARGETTAVDHGSLAHGANRRGISDE
jgi:hypothetical protein